MAASAAVYGVSGTGAAGEFIGRAGEPLSPPREKLKQWPRSWDHSGRVYDVALPSGFVRVRRRHLAPVKVELHIGMTAGHQSWI